MPPPITEYVDAGATAALSVGALRAFPVLVSFFASQAGSWRQKLGALSAYGALAFLAVRYSEFHARDLLIAYGYLMAVSAVPYFLKLPRPRATLFPLILGLFFVIPALCFHAQSLLLLLGWELTLSTYSYCVETAAAGGSRHHTRSFDQYWFFLFVNPTVAYPRRGASVAEPGLSWPGLRRAGLGMTALALSGVLGLATAIPAQAKDLLVAKAALIALRIASVYAAHWGLASLQIGLVRQVGHEAPERYRQPYRATSPRDFWARWNTYLGAWIRFYVFEPIVRLNATGLRSKLKFRRMRTRLVATLASFLFIGALHDLYAMLVAHQLAMPMTLWFGANALALIAWDAAATVAPHAGNGGIWRGASVTAMLGVLVVLAIALP